MSDEKVDEFALSIEGEPVAEEGKPYPNEHACRLNDPGKYDHFARKNNAMKHDGKRIDVIFGVKKGGAVEMQAMRYPKKIWDASDARSHCQSHNGSFEAAKD